MEMDVHLRAFQEEENQEKMNTSGDIFESSDHEAGSLSSVDLFADSDDDVNDTKPIGDIPMEIDQPGPSNLRSVFDRIEQEPVPEELNPEIVDFPLELGEPPAKIGNFTNRTAEEERLAKTMARLRAESDKGERKFGRYMQLKKDKLRYQVNVISRVDNVVSSIFQGISIFVNGHTDPSALELRELIQTHGGDYHCYMEYGHTTYTIASSLASAKVDKTRKNEIFLLPGWIIDCIAAGRLLPIDDYRLLLDSREINAPITNFFAKAGAENPTIQQREKALDARDPNFIQEFYARSRLHLISTLAQDMKDFMTMIRETGHFNNEEWDKVNLSTGEGMIDEPLIFHIDLDCFFVSVALRDRPELRDKPVAITHSRGSATAPGFSEVASVSYAARKLGIKNGMLVRDVLKLCPSLICLPYQFDDYRLVSKAIYTLVSKFTLEVRGVSCDEMYVNFTKSCREKRIADVKGLANHIRTRIREETGCAASIGIGPNMLLARLATRKAKPDGVYWTRKNDAASFIANEKIVNIPGVGYATVQKMLEKFGGELETCGDLQRIDCQDLQALFGKIGGLHIWQHCRGEDDSLKDFLTNAERKSVSCDINYGIRFTKQEEVFDFLRRAVEEVCKKLNSCRRITGCVTLKLMVRSADAPVDTAKYLGHGRCDTTTKTAILKRNTDSPESLLKEVLILYDMVRPPAEDLRGVGIHCGRLVPADAGVRKLQMMKNFFDPKPRAPPTVKPPEPKKKEEEKKKTKVEDLVEPPKLNGLTVLSEIKTEIHGYLVEDPTEANVRRLSRYLFQLKEYGAYSTIRELCIFLSRLQSEPETPEDWQETLDHLFRRLDTAIYWYWGGKFVEKELQKHPLTTNRCHKICQHTDGCKCEY